MAVRILALAALAAGLLLTRHVLAPSPRSRKAGAEGSAAAGVELDRLRRAGL